MAPSARRAPRPNPGLRPHRPASKQAPASATRRCCSSVVEHSLGKGEVESSIPSSSTTFHGTRPCKCRRARPSRLPKFPNSASDPRCAAGYLRPRRGILPQRRVANRGRLIAVDRSHRVLRIELAMASPHDWRIPRMHDVAPVPRFAASIPGIVRDQQRVLASIGCGSAVATPHARGTMVRRFRGRNGLASPERRRLTPAPPRTLDPASTRHRLGALDPDADRHAARWHVARARHPVVRHLILRHEPRGVMRVDRGLLDQLGPAIRKLASKLGHSLPMIRGKGSLHPVVRLRRPSSCALIRAQDPASRRSCLARR